MDSKINNILVLLAELNDLEFYNCCYLYTKGLELPQCQGCLAIDL